MTKLIEFFRVLYTFIRCAPTLIFFKPPADEDKTSLGLMFQKTAARHANKSAIIFEGVELNWSQFNALANQFAHSLALQGIQRGDTVAVFMENRIELLCSIVALSKLGAVAGLINTGLTDRPLAHCINTIDSKKCLVGEELITAMDGVRSEIKLTDNDYLWVGDHAIAGIAPDWTLDFTATLTAMPVTNLPQTDDIRAVEIALYIFTSGTTGLPKPVIVPHRKIMSASRPFTKVGFNAKPSDRMYVCLPLYHITGFLLGVGTCFYSGASIFLRRRFSATQFWPEVQKYQTTLFIYVGELCRYLAMQPECPEEKNNPIRSMLGNGLRPDVWGEFRNRFAVKRICEIYGASESNATFLNILNKDDTIGTSSADLLIVEYDVDADEISRDSNGQLIQVALGGTGLLLSKVDEKYQFDGYKDKQASDDKILTDVLESGDRWFNTGDLIRQIDVGFAMGLPHFQFVDRVGDTFRWRAENVSTNEVGEILNACEQVEISNVYGVEVPGVEGRAGMAAITLKDGIQFDAQAFSLYAHRELPSFACPVFVRIEKEQDTTGTFKLVKGQLKKEAFHLDQIDQPVYIKKPNSNEYELLDQAFYAQILAGKSGF
jgi:citronellyl-CoA synthetase